MVFGNMGDDSGTGVAFTRDPNTGEKVLYGEYLTNAQGEDVVAGIRTAPKIAQMAEDDARGVRRSSQRIGQQLEAHYRNVQDLEFTIERGRLYMLQTRDAKRTAAAAVKIAVDMVDEGVITKEEAVGRIEPAQVDQLLRAPVRPQRRCKGAKRIAKGLNASPGAAVGRAVFDADAAVEWVDRGEKVILVRVETSPDDFHGMAVARGHPHRPRRRDLARGGRRPPDRQAVRRRLRRARSSTTPRKTGALQRSRAPSFKEGDWISVDGSTGEVFLGALPTVSARFEDQPELQQVLGWADEIRRHAGLDQRRQARGGRPGPRLRRPGHRPLPHRAHVPRGRAPGDRPRRHPRRERRRPGPRPRPRPARRSTADEAEAVATFDAAMAKLEVLQQGDFEGIFAAMDGLPVVIRLIDPPLHEFLPNLEDQLVKVTRAEERRRRVRGGQGAARDDQVDARAEPDARPARLPPRA